MTLGTVTDDGNLTVLDDGQIGVIVVVDLCHSVFLSLLGSGLSWDLGNVTRGVSPREQPHHG